MQLIITEKPYVHMNINKALTSLTADGICNVHLFYKFNYDDFNFPSKPRYQHDDKCDFTYNMYHHRNGQLTTGSVFDFKASQYEKFLSYSEICLFVEPDHSGVRCTDLFLDHFFGNLQDKYPITFTVIELGTDEHIRDAYENRLDFFKLPITKKEKTIHDKIDKYRKQYEIKDYIDFNFNGLMKQLFPTGQLLMTRNKMMALLLIAESTEPLDSNKFIGKLVQYDIGNPAAKSEIVRNLVDAEFLTPDLYSLTKNGKLFLERLPSGLKNFELLKLLQTIDAKELTHEQKMLEIENSLKSIFELV